MPLIKNRQVVTDSYQLAETAPLPDGDVLLPFELFQSLESQLVGRNGGLAVKLTPDQDWEQLLPHLDRIHALVLVFPKFSDGRHYSTARLLRERHGFKGEIRAAGDFGKDQIHFLHRCGFDAFDLPAHKSVEDSIKALDEFTVTYQAAVDDQSPLFRRAKLV